MSERKKAQLFILASLIMLLVSMATKNNVFFYVAVGLLSVVIISDIIYGK